MTLTRWKLLAGVFGISVCGIAALAQPVGQKTATAPETVAQSACAAAPPVPLVIPLPMPAPTPEVAIPLPLPTAQTETVPPPRLAVTTPGEAPPVAVPPPTIELPKVETRTAEKTVSAAELAQFIQDAAKAGEPVAQPVPVMTLPQMPPPAPPALPTPAPPAPPATPKTTVQTTGYTTPTAPVAEKKFKVLLQFGDTLPKFEIRDGEETLLKVVADKVDVKSPAERSELWATLKATGQVKFVTPGGEGVCDELQVVPGSGEVIAIGSVKFTTNWGKVETSVTSDRMNFRLGKAPTLSHAPTSSATPTAMDGKDLKPVFLGSYVGWIGGQ